jgi:uncharacterized protein (TIGR03435 family)
MPVSALTEPFGGVTSRPIVDRTGLTGRFDYDLTVDAAGARSRRRVFLYRGA